MEKYEIADGYALWIDDKHKAIRLLGLGGNESLGVSSDIFCDDLFINFYAFRFSEKAEITKVLLTLFNSWFKRIKTVFTFENYKEENVTKFTYSLSDYAQHIYEQFNS